MWIKKQIFAGLFLLAGLLPGSSLGAAGVFSTASDLGGGNRYSEWFGAFNDLNYPWIHHVKHGWIYCADGSEVGVWLWMPGIGWAWTSEAIYPELHEEHAGWLRYDGGASGARWFYDHSTAQVVREGNEPGGESYFPVPDSGETLTWLYSVNGGKGVTLDFDGLRMTLFFTRYAVAFNGSDLSRSISMNARLGPQAYMDGMQFPVSGSFGVSSTEQYARSALGLYLRHVEGGFDLNIKVDGLPVRADAFVHTSGFGELLIGFPWREDLYALPVGTVFNQVTGSGWVSGNYSMEIEGYPEDSESGIIDMPVGGLTTVRWEITGKEAQMTVAGRVYKRVVSVRASLTEPDPYTGEMYPVVNTIWLAPGVGMIRMLEDDPMIGTPVTVELTQSSEL